MDHQRNCPDEMLEAFRPYLELLARGQLDRRLRAKVDLSGVVNLTLHEAHKQSEKVRELGQSDQLRWLRRILANNLIDATRAYTGPKRDATREVSIEARMEESSNRLVNCLVADQTSPSGRAARNEDLVRVAAALESLPDALRTAVECHQLQGMSLADTAERLGKTKAAAAGLYYRGLKKLRGLLSDQD